MGLNLRAKLRRLREINIIIDNGKRLGNFELVSAGYDASLIKESISRKYLFEEPGVGLRFLDVGARDGKLSYLLGIQENLAFDEELYSSSFKRFQEKYDYYGMDLSPSENDRILTGDICSNDFLTDHSRFKNFFDFVYSNNVFEHLRRPWIAVQNLWDMLKPNGICATIVPFSQRYHESPGDYFRYTHKGLVSLFEEVAGVDRFTTLVSGYDIRGRRNNWQGSGEANDIVPVDKWGAWRETWFAVCLIRKKAN